MYHPRVGAMSISSTNHIDRYIRIINYEDGPRYCDLSYVRARTNQIRRIGNTYCAQNFYADLARAGGMVGGRIERAHAAMRTKCTNGIRYVLPQRIHIWDSDVCDIFASASAEWLFRDFLHQREENGEFERTSMGCAIKPTGPLVGQTKHNRHRKLKEANSNLRRTEIQFAR